VLDWLREAGSKAESETPVIIVSASDDAINEPSALEAGATAFVQKPWEVAQLLTLIKAHQLRRDPG
jgi:DNA-binding response OmpR family regulator